MSPSQWLEKPPPAFLHRCKPNLPPPKYAKEDFKEGNLLQQRGFIGWVQSWYPKGETDKHLPQQRLLKWVCAQERVATREEKRERGFTLPPEMEKQLNPWAAQPECSHGEVLQSCPSQISSLQVFLSLELQRVMAENVTAGIRIPTSVYQELIRMSGACKGEKRNPPSTNKIK